MSPVDEASLLKDDEEPVDLNTFVQEETKKVEPRKSIVPDPMSQVLVSIPEEVKNENFGDYDSSDDGDEYDDSDDDDDEDAPKKESKAPEKPQSEQAQASE